MTWLPLLLTDPSPCLRLRVMRELLGRAENDGEVQELAALRAQDPLVTALLEQQQVDGSWPGPAGEPVRGTAQALLRLGYLGYGPDLPAVQRGASYLFAQQQADGAWPLAGADEDGEAQGNRRGAYDMVPLQTALPLRSLAVCGYTDDPRAERAYDWLLAQRLSDGAWPTGLAAGDYGYVAGYRRLAHSRFGCRSNTTGVLLCLAHHPTRRSSPEAKRALDLLLGRETRESHTLGYEVARLIGAEPARGFFTYYARFDLALVLDLCARIGAGLDDARVRRLVEFVRGVQGPYGLWSYPAKPQVARWVTFDLLRSLLRIDQAPSSDWVSLEPPTPFQTYARQARRY